MPLSTELYFAISCASAISVQLNPRLAAPELRGILHDSQCQYIFAPSELELMQLLVDVDTTTNTVVKGVIWVDAETDGWAPAATMTRHPRNRRRAVESSKVVRVARVARCLPSRRKM